MSSNELVRTVGAPAIANMDDLARVSEMFAKSGLFRDSRDAAQAGVKILAGLESGFGAFAAMSGVHVIEGKASIGANLMALAIKRSGKYNYKVLEHTETSCSVEIYERWDGVWQSAGKSGFTIDDAKAAGVRFKDSKNNPTPWAKFPRNMLFARAISNAVRWYCPDCMNVTAYVAEELGATVDGEGDVIQAELVELESAPETPEPVAPTVVTPKPGNTANTQAETPVEETVAPESIGPGRAREMLKALAKLGLTVEKQLALFDRVTKATRDVIGIEPSDLTVDEAKRVMGVAKREAAKPVWEKWQSDEDARTYAAKSETFSSGQELMTGWESVKAQVGKENDGDLGDLYRIWFEFVNERIEAEKKAA